MENLPPLRQLQYLAALGQHRSFSRAADACHVTQSTFSAGIAALEAMLGQKLVSRSTRSVGFTAIGEEILTKAQRVLDQAAELTSFVKTAEAPLSGPLRMGIIPTIAPYFLPRLLPLLRKQWPALKLSLQEDISSQLVALLTSGKLDVVLMAFPFSTPGLRQKTLFSENFVLASPAMVENKKKVKPAELDQLNLLLLEEGHCLRSHALAACHTPNINKTFRTTSLPTLIQMVKNGYGSTLLPQMVLSAGAVPKGIIVREFEKPVPTREIGLCWREKTIPEQNLKYLGETIRAAAGFA